MYTYNEIKAFEDIIYMLFNISVFRGITSKCIESMHHWPAQ